MPYEIYKILHLSSLVLLFTCIAVTVFADSPKKIFKILTGVSTVLVLISGFGLIARLGIPQGEPWGLWLYAKIAIWAIVGIGAPIVIKRMAAHKAKFFWISYVLFIIAAICANYKFN